MNEPRTAIAIVGMAGRFPGAPDLDAFWRNLAEGVESLETFSDDELRAAGVPDALASLDRYVRAGTVLEGSDRFDAGFFGISPREAEIIDPQHRLFLECAWEALEDAGYAPQHSPGSVGVYAGCSMNTYYSGIIARNPEIMGTAGGYQLMLGNDKDFLPTRVSYKLDLRGPSLAIQTACSTSLVAVQEACQGLLRHQCDMALAGGVSLFFPEKTGYLYQEGMIFSPDGHCRPFDAEGKGIRAGAGAGIVVLKRLADALADGDSIRAVIRGAAINNDGSNKVGYTAPSVDGQAEVIAMAQALAGVEPDTISYVEAHGTGTPLGDPIELAALTQVFRARTGRQRFCAIGSVKSNIGHLDAAAGVAGLLKTVLCLEHRAIPPSLNFSTPNPAIDFAAGPFFVNTTFREWGAEAGPRRAGVSSFGIGGTNAHVVVEEAPAPEPTEPPGREQLLVLSAKSAAALESATSRLAAHLEAHPEQNLADVGYTLQVGREAFGHRRLVVARDRQQAIDVISTGNPERLLSGDGSRARPVVFMFSGQGSQYLQMGRELFEADPEFRRSLEECAGLLEPHLGQDLLAALYPAPGAGPLAPEASGALNQTRLAQPALFAVEYALARMWMARGVVPEAMIGHSIGEYAAACIAGVLSLEDAVSLVAARGRLMQAMPGGAMLSVPLPESELTELLGDRVTLAAVNAPGLCTVSGPTEAVARLEAALTRRGIACRPLHASHAFHSAMMEPVLEPFRQRLREVRLREPEIPFVSNLSGTWITPAQATDPGYWADHLRQPVRFAPGLQELANDPGRIFLEVGPGNALGTFARQTLGAGAGGVQVLASLPHPQQRQDADRFALTTLGRLWLLGVPVAWATLHHGSRRRRLPLPTYPFERQRYWVDPAPGFLVPQGAAAGPVKRPDLDDWFYAPAWLRSAALDAEPQAALPGGAWLIFDDGLGVGAALARELAGQGRTVTSVGIGAGLEEVEAGRFVLDPADAGQYARLLAALKAAGRMPAWVVHLWSLTGPGAPPGTLDGLEGAQARGFSSLLGLAQAIGHVGASEPMRITVVSNGMQSVISDAEVRCPEKATLLGPCTVIPLEYPGVECRSVDIEFPADGAEALTRLTERLLREAVLTRPSGHVAWREGRRWELGYEQVPLAPPSRPEAPARDGGVYLITGGTGGLGLAFARHLAQARGVVLVLTSRTAVPPRDQWDEWLAGHSPEERAAAIIREVRALEELGARVEVASADVADEVRMRSLIADVLARFGAIHGVIHAAGTPGGGIIQLKTPEFAKAVLDPKVRGTLILESALRGQPLDFFVLCSSINAMVAGPGAADYCGANAFLDAYAHARRGRGDAGVISINWDTWQEVGMAVIAAVPAELREAKRQSLLTGIRSGEGVAALARAVASRLPQVVVSTRDLHVLIYYQRFARAAAARSAAAGPEAEAGAGAPDGGSRHARPELATPFVAPRTDEERGIAAIWGALLGIEAIGVHDSFFELGGHSLLATQVLARLQDSVGVSLPLETIFDAPTIAELAERVATLRWLAEGTTADRGDQAGREEFEL